MKRESIFLEMDKDTIFSDDDTNSICIMEFNENRWEWSIIETDNMGSVLLCHGKDYGALTIEDEDLFRLYDRIDHIVCCHPKEVILFYEIIFPDIGSKVFFPEHNSLVFSQAVVVENKILMEVMSFQSVVDK